MKRAAYLLFGVCAAAFAAPSASILPKISMKVEPAVVKAGSPFTVRLYGEDDVGLDSVWWFVEKTGDPVLDKQHRQVCRGAKRCLYVWKGSARTKGSFLLRAKARDTAYQVEKFRDAHQASEREGTAQATIVVE